MTGRSATLTAAGDHPDSDITARRIVTPTVAAPGHRATVKEAIVTISGGLAVAAVALQWLVPICFSC